MKTGFLQQLALFPGLVGTSLPAQPNPAPSAVSPSRQPPPQAERQRYLHLGNQIVPYSLRLGQGRRRLSMTIDERGLRVGAPTRTTLAEVESFVRMHAAWVLAKLQEHTEQHRQRHLNIQDGSRLPLLGGDVAVRLAVMTSNGRMRAHWQEDHVLLEVRENTGRDEHAAMLRRALQRRALELFTERMAHYARLMGRELPLLGLSSARTRWGSCSLKSGIRLNWRLIHLPLALIDYVIVHELAHLIEMNHSPRFWAQVGALYPDWKNARNELKRCGRSLPTW
jgi:predicted metal-dependent hydrolase